MAFPRVLFGDFWSKISEVGIYPTPDMDEKYFRSQWELLESGYRGFDLCDASLMAYDACKWDKALYDINQIFRTEYFPTYL
tara:strand:+ start:92 stop:334 length:243 start_codon:yes stop_codon:yes gene_type:complete